jgi:hypothetical protein
VVATAGGSVKAEDVINLVVKLDKPSAKALAELKKVCVYNDAQTSHYHRVAAEDAMKLLSANGFQCGSRVRLNRACRLLGRKSYVQK